MQTYKVWHGVSGFQCPFRLCESECEIRITHARARETQNKMRNAKCTMISQEHCDLINVCMHNVEQEFGVGASRLHVDRRKSGSNY